MRNSHSWGNDRGAQLLSFGPSKEKAQVLSFTLEQAGHSAYVADDSNVSQKGEMPIMTRLNDIPPQRRKQWKILAHDIIGHKQVAQGFSLPH